MSETPPRAGRWPRPPSRREGLAATSVVVAAIAMLLFTWDTWPDAVYDSGRELYVAWQLATGQVLYRDVAYFNGPLSPYINAAWFALVGPGIGKLEALNGAVFAMIAALTWHLVRRVAGWPAAAASALVLVTLFAFGPLTIYGSFSYLLPYSHEMTHGLLLLLLLLAALDRFLETGGRRSVECAGGVLGSILLTKPEFVIAGCAAAAVGFGLAVLRPHRTQGIAVLAPLAVSAMIPPLVAFAGLASVMPAGVAFDGILGSWAHLANHAIGVMPYFRHFMGVDRPLASVAMILAWSVVWAAALALAVLAGRTLGRVGRFEGPVAAVLAAATASLLFAGHAQIPWRDALRPLPLAVLAVFAWAVVALWRGRNSDSDTSRPVLAAAASAMSLALMLKMLLFARIWHYGFVLGMPGVMLAVAACARSVPAAVRRRGGSPLIAGGVLSGILIGAIAGHLALMEDTLSGRTVHVASGTDAFLSDERGRVIESALEALEELAPKHATLAVLPDGVMLSYLARRPNSTPYVIGNPVDVAIFGEARMLAAYRAKPPDFFALLRCDIAMYGVEGFGQGYAEQLAAWIYDNYDPIVVVRTEDVRDDAFLAVLFKRRDAAASPSAAPQP